MFATIRRHQKWLWVVIMSATIISFVVYFSPNVGGGRGGGGGGVFSGGGSENFGSIGGRSLSREELMQAKLEAYLRYRLYSGSWPGQDDFSRQMFNEDREMENRLLVLEKLRELDVKVSDEAVA